MAGLQLRLDPGGPHHAASSDVSVQGTNDDAQVSKLSCAKLGYFRDDFIQHFVRRKTARRSPLINRGYYSRHAGLSLLRTKFLAAAADASLPAQVLVLGAGFDTTWLQLAAEGRAPARYLELDFLEVTMRKAATIASHPQLMSVLEAAAAAPPPPPPAAPVAAPGPSPHAAALPQQPQQPLPPCPTPAAAASEAAGAAPPPPPASQLEPLPSPSHAPPGPCSAGALGEEGGGGERRAPMGPPMAPPHAAHAAAGSGAGASGRPGGGAAGSGAARPGVHVCPAAGEVVCGGGAYCVLPADLRDLAAVRAAIARAGLDTSAPTFILAECVLVYMEPSHSADLVRMLGRTFSNAAMVVYEQVRPDDAFGRQMTHNLEERGCPLLGLSATPTLEAHCARMTSEGAWQAAAAWDMDTVYKAHLDPADRARIERLEIFDEFEEWHMIQEHYCITVGVNCPGSDGAPEGGSQGTGGGGGLLRGFGFGAPQCGGT